MMLEWNATKMNMKIKRNKERERVTKLSARSNHKEKEDEEEGKPAGIHLGEEGREVVREQAKEKDPQ